MIAQEVEKLFPEIVAHIKDSSQDNYMVNKSAYGVIAIKAIQEQQKKIETLEERIAKLEAVLDKAIGKKNNSLPAINKSVAQESNTALEQNSPNPFSQSTAIRYHIPHGAKAQIHIYDINGAFIKSVEGANGQGVIDASDLKPGSYTYTLSVNSNVIDSKKMIVLK